MPVAMKPMAVGEPSAAIGSSTSGSATIVRDRRIAEISLRPGGDASDLSRLSSVLPRFSAAGDVGYNLTDTISQPWRNEETP